MMQLVVLLNESISAGNQWELNNRYDLYLDLANLEVCLEGHAKVGVFILFIDHPHYFDNAKKRFRSAAAVFNTRQGHRYAANTRLTYNGSPPSDGGTELLLIHDCVFRWGNVARPAGVLVLGWSPVHHATILIVKNRSPWVVFFLCEVLQIIFCPKVFRGHLYIPWIANNVVFFSRTKKHAYK